MEGKRRGFILGFAAIFAAPSIVRAQNIMPVSVVDRPDFWLRPHKSDHWDVPNWTAGWYQPNGLPEYKEVPPEEVSWRARRNPKTFILNRDYYETRRMHNIPEKRFNNLNREEDAPDLERIGGNKSTWVRAVRRNRAPQDVTRAAKDTLVFDCEANGYRTL